MFPDFDAGPTAPGPHRVTVFGHQPVVAALSGAVAAGRATQSYLLAGPPAVGKRTVARWFAQLVSCLAEAPEARPCGHCRACRLVAADGWPDLHIMAPPLRIEAVRALQHDLALAPGEGRYRIAILPEVELASPGAANSLLKTLEEPPRQVILLLTTADPGAVLPTVRSRCQLLPLRPLTTDAAQAALSAGWAVDPERAALLARLSGGRLGWAVRALADDTLLGARAAWLDGLARARAANLADRLALAAELTRANDPLPDGLAVWGSWWRDVLLTLHGLADGVVNRDRAAELEAAAARYGPRQVVGCLRGIDAALRQLAANTGPQLALEVLLLEMP
jgi:DNA polymerase-3 subunit delta'